MSEEIIQLMEKVIEGESKELVQSSIEEMPNELLEAEKKKLTQVARQL